MFQRPRPGETNEDLLKQEEALKAQGAFASSAKLVHINKRKTEEEQNASVLHEESRTPRSKFAKERSIKKKKEGIVDNTVLKEAVSKDKSSVLGRIVERFVPAEETLREWHPEPSPYGFPQASKLETLTTNVHSKSESGFGAKKQSLYKQQLIKKGIIKDTIIQTSSSVPSAATDLRLNALGTETYVIKDNSIIQEDDAKKMHEENMNKIASMTHEERLNEQQEILSSLSPDQLNFLKSLRKIKEEKKRTVEVQSDPSRRRDLQDSSMECDVMEGKVGGSTSVCRAEDLEKCSPAVTPKDRVEKLHVTFSEDIEMKEISSTDETELEDMGIPIPLSESMKWLNMSKVEVEKLKALTDMPTPKPLRDNEGFVARFDFEGNILPYDKDVSHLKGLHHHGEEAGRPGYSLDEIFVFCRSKVLQQRSLGLCTLANILRNAKEGMYDKCVSPPVIHLAVEAGAVLILRFALDETSELVYKEAVRALYYLITSEPDEQCLSLAQPWIPWGLEPGVASDIHANEKVGIGI
ncbi:hypothetical protein SK128_015475 [Halocaridina rubra]|uniref:Uncharacterized protein n=1 Tax=Halocaridina rubra TaxID=373956 RepID=A0AAN8XJ13_HALRR